jgi:type I restriction enzyme S subunit
MNTEVTQTIANIAEVNPSIDLRGLCDDTLVSFIPMSDVTDSGRWTGIQERHLDEVHVGYTPFAEGDVLFAKITPCMENGKGAHARGLRNGVGFGSTEFHVLRARGQNNPRFLFHWLQARFVRLRAIAYMGGSAGQQRVQSDFFTHFRIPQIEPAEQSRIASVLDTVDEAIEKTEAVIAKLQQVRAGLLHDLLTRGLDEHGQFRDPIAHPEQFQGSPLGQIPKEWEVLPLERVAEVDRGKFTHRPRNDPAFYGGHFPFIQTGDIALAAGETITEASQSLNDRGASVSKEFPVGTIAVTIAANIGDTTILGRPMYFPDSVVGVVTHEPHSTRWIELSLRRAKQRLNALAPQSAQKNINLEFLRPLLILVPHPCEQERCSALYEITNDQLQAESKTLEKLNLLKSGLMSDLLTGRVRVPEEIAVAP